MNRLLILTAVVFWASLHTAPGAVTVTGHVTLPAPKPGRAASARYQLTTTQPSGKESTGPVAVVYLEGVFENVEAPATSIEMGQKNLQFSPRLLVVQKGAEITFPNMDDEYHNVLSYSKAKALDLGRYLKTDKAPLVSFDKTGVVELSCEIHEHMQATILVLDTPYFTFTDAEGAFRMEGLPAGSYTLKAWLNRRTVLEQPITLKDGETQDITLGDKK
jgi:plastocyanin